ncbi:MAG: restriction endonuclease subunit S [Nitrosomonas sp.]|nr:restriction endonuclease subunit S [Nitrosomonas sp.]
MSEWRKCKLSEVAVKFAMGPFGSNIKAENFTNIGVPVIRGTNLNYYRYVDGEFVYLTEEKANQLKSSNCFPGDIVVTHRGTLGQVGLIPFGKFDRYVISQSGMKVTVNPEFIDSNFLLYFFKSNIGQNELLQHESQVGVPSISNPLTSLKSVSLNLPPLPEQKAIASILSSLDDKIDLLHRQNKTLEAMAETLFRQWFVEEAEIQSENQLILGELIESVSITHKLQTDTIIFLNTSDIYKGDVLINSQVNVDSLPGQAKKSIQRNDILFSEIRPANGRWAYIHFDAEDYVVSTKLMVLRSKGFLSQAFVYFFLTNSQTVDWLQLLAESRSGTFPQITFDQLRDLKINIPSKSILSNSIEWCESALKKINSNSIQIRTLETLRDTLLPKLMSGEVRVDYP